MSNNNKALLTLTIRLLTSLFAMSFLLNGVYEYYNLHNTSEAAFNFAMCALLLNWYLDVAKQDREVKTDES